MACGLVAASLPALRVITCLAASLPALQGHYLLCSVITCLAAVKWSYIDMLLGWLQDVHVNASGAGSELQTLT